MDWDFKGAEEEFKIALDLDPSYATAHHWYGRLTMFGRHEEAIVELELARNLNPDDISINRNLGWAYYKKSMFQELLDLYDSDPNSLAFLALYEMGTLGKKQNVLPSLEEFYG